MGSKRNTKTGAQREAERRAKAPGTSFAAVQMQLARESREQASLARDALAAERERSRREYEAEQVRRRAGIDSIVRLRRLVAYRAELDAEMAECVVIARASRWSWAQIAAAAGLSRDGAVSRWGRRQGRV